jgi:tRNA-dihydrouridine synthase A
MLVAQSSRGISIRSPRRIDRTLEQQTEPLSREAVEAAMVAYVEHQMARTKGWEHGEVRWPQVIRHILGLYHGLKGARRWRQVWSDHTLKHHLPSEVMRLAHQRPQAGDEAA